MFVALTSLTTQASARSGVQEPRCPRHVTPLPPAGALSLAKHAALQQAPRFYRGLDLEGRTAVSAYIVRRGTPRSVDAGHCGLYGRTVLVELRFPRELPSSSLSEGAVYVSRIKPPGRGARYLLWRVEH
jgi:hypothetical protein